MIVWGKSLEDEFKEISKKFIQPHLKTNVKKYHYAGYSNSLTNAKNCISTHTSKNHSDILPQTQLHPLTQLLSK
jgi:hypothetical protein